MTTVYDFINEPSPPKGGIAKDAKACSNCEHFILAKKVPNKGVCTAHPPSLLAERSIPTNAFDPIRNKESQYMQHMNIGMYPEVLVHWRCGMFTRKETNGSAGEVVQFPGSFEPPVVGETEEVKVVEEPDGA